MLVLALLTVSAAKGEDSQPADSLQINLQQGDSCMQQYNTFEALGYYRRAFALADTYEVRTKLADCYYKRANYREVADLLKLIPEDSLSHDAFRQLANSYKKQGDNDSYVYWANRLVERYPMDGEIVAGLILGYAQQNQPQKGIICGLKYSLRDSTDILVHRALADAWFLNRDFTAAAMLYDRLLAQGDSTFNTLYSAGMSHSQTGNLERAYQYLLKAFLISGMQHYGCAYRLGVVCIDTKRYPEGLGYLDLAKELMLPDTTVMKAITLSQGEGYYLTEHYPEAVAAWKEHLAYNPGSVATYYNIANAYAFLLKDQDQRGYHESAPYAKANEFRTQCMKYIAQAGGQIKYGHSEVGNFSLDGMNYEQNEIEFLPVPVEQAADQLMLAKWIIRNLGYEMGYDVTFAPKITTGKAGSGLHIHMRMVKDGKNQMLAGGVLSESARKMIAGMMDLAPSITAFGNKNPMSYFRLVPHQEAPTNVCWGDRNRSVLVRVPLGWAADVDMSHKANPLEVETKYDTSIKQTVEMRSPDGSADLYQLLAGLCVACRHGFEMDQALELAEKTYVNVNIHAAEHADRLATLAQLPDSCVASADCLERQRKVFEEHTVFSPAMIDGIIAQLRAFDDKTLRRDVEGYPDEIQKLVTKYFHCG